MRTRISAFCLPPFRNVLGNHYAQLGAITAVPAGIYGMAKLEDAIKKPESENVEQLQGLPGQRQ